MELPVDGRVKHWGIPKVVQWLQENRMDVYIEDFRNGYIDGEKLLNGEVNAVSLRQLNVHPTHSTQLLDAIKNYKFDNPDADYETGSDDDDFDEDGDTNDSIEPYQGPDDVMATQAVKSFRHVPAPRPESDELPGEETYLDPDNPPPNPSSYPKPGNFSHRALPPTPPDELDAKLPANRTGRLASLPETRAPEPPKSYTPGRRPAIPTPTHTPIRPTVPVAESLDSAPPPPPQRPCKTNTFSPPKVVEPDIDQENYEEVCPDPVPKNNNMGNNSRGPPGRTGPLPPPPDSDDNGSGGSISYFSDSSSHSAKGKYGKNQYPLVIPAGNSNNRLSPTPKRKVIQSYTDHSLQNDSHHDSETTNNFTSSTTPLTTPPRSRANLPAIPVTPTQRNTPAREIQPPQHTAPTPSSSQPVNTSALTIKERKALLDQQTSDSGNHHPIGGLKLPVGGTKPPVSQRSPNLMQAMQDKQNQRKLGENAPVGNNKPGHNFNQNKPVANQRPPVVPPARTLDKCKSHPPLPAVPNSTPAAPPAVPATQRPPRIRSTASIDSDSSSAANSNSDDGDRGLYNYTWYHSDIDRSRSAAILKRKHHNGAFLVRKSIKDATKPFTLDVMNEGHDFHIPLRRREDGNYALGATKEDKLHWGTVSDLVSYFKTNLLALTKTTPDRHTIRASTYLKE